MELIWYSYMAEFCKGLTGPYVAHMWLMHQKPLFNYIYTTPIILFYLKYPLHSKS